MLTFEGRALWGNPLQRSGSGLEPDLDPNRAFGPIANFNYLTSNTNNHRCLVDAHFPKNVVKSSRAFLPRMATNTVIMNMYDQITF